jgi:hypothetical protein
MSMPERKTGPLGARSAEVLDDDVDLLEALQFAQGDHAPTRSAIRNTRDSLITVPPAVTSVPSVAVAPLRVPSISYVALDPIPPSARSLSSSFAAATATLKDGSVGRASWAALMATLVVALPGGLLLGGALASHPAAGTGRRATASTMGVEADVRATDVAAGSPDPIATAFPAFPTTPIAEGTASARVLAYPGDLPVVVRAPSRVPHHGKGKAASKAAANADSLGGASSASGAESIPAR